MKRVLSLLLALLLLLSMPLLAFAEETETVYLDTPEAFAAFLDACALESYSAGRRFVLRSDLDLSAVNARPAPFFAGSFDGGNHWITGFSFTGEGSRQGLFRTVSEDGEVRSLRLRASVTPEGSQSDVGGLAGVNLGSISGCIVEGRVNGVTDVGGLVGLNGETGRIERCSVSALVTGEHQVGGIVGLNRGFVSDCVSNASVNTIAITPVGESSFDLSSLSTEDFVNLSSIGGVAGENTGVLTVCRNNGSVGYKYTGYNVGGICGKNSGLVDACRNAANVEGRRDVGGIVGQLIPYAAWDFSDGQLDALSGQIQGLHYLISEAARKAGDQSAALRAQLGQMNGFTSEALSALSGILGSYAENDQNIVNSLREQLELDPESGQIRIPQVDVQRVDTSALTAALANLYSQSTVLASSMGDQVSAVAEDLQAIGNQMSRIFDTLFSVVSNISSANLVNVCDLSADEAYDHDEGAVASCENLGAVKAETNAGGIVGTVAFEIAFDMEDTLNSSNLITTNAKEYLFAAIRACSSICRVQSKNDNVGGVVGRMDIGAVVDCVSKGSFQSLNGSCAGGIAGTTRGTVSGCWARADLGGASYLGGIAGLGAAIRDSRAWAHFEDQREYSGAIAGWTEEEVSGNCYVEGRPAGVDDVSRVGQCEPLRLPYFLRLEGTPEGFETVTVRFYDEDRLLDKVDVTFGRRLSRVPQVENRGASFWVWDDFDPEHVYFDQEIHGAYHSPTSVLSTGEAVPRFLAEGQFYEGQSLSVQTDPISGDLNVTVNGYEGELLLHMLSEEDAAVSLISPKGEETPLETRRDGSYLLFSAPSGASLRVQAVERQHTSLLLILSVSGLVLLAAVLLLLHRRKKKKSRSATE